MRTTIARLLIIAAVGIGVTTVLSAQTVEVTDTRGKVEYREGSGAWQSVLVDMALPVGATISTGFGASAELLAGDATITVEALTRLTIEELIAEQGSQQTDLYLQVGRVRAEVRTGDDVQHDFRLRSAVSTAAVRGTVFEYDGYSVTGFEGQVSFSSNTTGIGQLVGQGDQSKVGAGGSAPESPREERRRRTQTTTRQETPRDRQPTGGGGPPRRRPDSPTSGAGGGIDDVVESNSTLVIEIDWPE